MGNSSLWILLEVESQTPPDWTFDATLHRQWEVDGEFYQGDLPLSKASTGIVSATKSYAVGSRPNQRASFFAGDINMTMTPTGVAHMLRGRTTLSLTLKPYEQRGMTSGRASTFRPSTTTFRSSRGSIGSNSDDDSLVIVEAPVWENKNSMSERGRHVAAIQRARESAECVNQHAVLEVTESFQPGVRQSARASRCSQWRNDFSNEEDEWKDEVLVQLQSILQRLPTEQFLSAGSSSKVEFKRTTSTDTFTKRLQHSTRSSTPRLKMRI